MDTQKLKYFCTIVEAGGLTAAAGILGISHSGLSKSMSLLQEELNIKLFIPQGRGLELTPEGKIIYDKSKFILKLLHQLPSLQEISHTQPLLCIGLPEVMALSISGELTKQLDQPTQFLQLESGAAELHILENKLDFCFTFIPFPHKQIEHLKIKKIPMGIFFQNKIFSGFSLPELPFVTPVQNLHSNPLDLRTQDGWPSTLQRQVAYQATTLSCALSIVDSGKTAIFIPKFLAQLLNQHRFPNQQLLEFNINQWQRHFSTTTREIFLAKKINQTESREMKIAAKIIRKFC